MGDVEFDIEKWFKPDGGSDYTPLSGADAPRNAPQSLYEDVETVIGRIEARHLDITADYKDWITIGLALADGFGESGRSYFHNVSRFYPKYKAKEADKVYSQCVKSHKGQVTIRTFFQKAKDAGVDIRTRRYVSSPISPVSPRPESGVIASSEGVANMAKVAKTERLGSFAERVELQLPDFLRMVAMHGETSQEKDVLILGSITTLSACLPNVSGLYDGVEVHPNLFFFLTARASSGKGRLNLCRLLVEGIHERLFEIYKLERQQYEMKKSEYEASKSSGTPRPEPPVKNMLFIPANSSATSVYQILGESNERGLIFETEGDTLAYSFASDFGNFSDGFRKAFHHEPISYHRRKDDEHVDIKHPQLTTVLSGTPEQLRSLVKDAENGLFSRFIYYRLDSGLTWKNVFATPTGKSLNTVFEELGRSFAEFHAKLMEAPYLHFCLTSGQIERFNDYFTVIQERMYSQFGENIIASVRRMGLIFYRIAMILTTLRIMETGDFYSNLVCSEEDFETTMCMVDVILQHTADVYVEVCGSAEPAAQERHSQRLKFYDALPGQFDRSGYVSVATGMGIPSRTADRYINHFCQNGTLERTAFGAYSKVEQQ